MTNYKNVVLILAAATLLFPTTSFSNEPQTVADEQQEEVVIEQPKSRYALVYETVRSHVLTNQKIYAAVAITTGLGLLAFATSSSLLKPMALPASPETYQNQQLKKRADEVHCAAVTGKPSKVNTGKKAQRRRVRFDTLTDSGRTLLANAQLNGQTEKQTLYKAINQGKPSVVRHLVAAGVDLSGKNEQGVGVDTLTGIHVTATDPEVLNGIGFDPKAHKKAVETRNVIASALSLAHSEDAATVSAALHRPRNAQRVLRVI